MIKIHVEGNFKNTDVFLDKAKTLNIKIYNILNKYGKEGVINLRNYTPKKTGKTANSWEYKILKDNTGYTLYWYNTNMNNLHNVAILLQYGHGTKNGTYVQGKDYINPALKPIFEKISQYIWKEVIT